MFKKVAKMFVVTVVALFVAFVGVNFAKGFSIGWREQNAVNKLERFGAVIADCKWQEGSVYEITCMDGTICYFDEEAMALYR